MVYGMDEIEEKSDALTTVQFRKSHLGKLCNMKYKIEYIAGLDLRQGKEY